MIFMRHQEIFLWSYIVEDGEEISLKSKLRLLNYIENCEFCPTNEVFKTEQVMEKIFKININHFRGIQNSHEMCRDQQKKIRNRSNWKIQTLYKYILQESLLCIILCQLSFSKEKGSEKEWNKNVGSSMAS